MSTEFHPDADTQVLDTNTVTTPLAADPSTRLFGASTPDTTPTPSDQVWNAQMLPDQEPPARGVRLGQLAWGLIVVLCGLFLVALAFVPASGFPLILIGLVAVLGITLIVIAVITSVAHPRRRQAS